MKSGPGREHIKALAAAYERTARLQQELDETRKPGGMTLATALQSFESIWKRQQAQQRNWYDVENMPEEERVGVLNALLLDLYEKVAELQHMLGRERYHILRAPPTPTAEDTAEVCVDVFKYLLCLMQLQGLNSEQFISAFYAKSDVVDDKWRCEQSDLSLGVEVVGIDLDGCVADWAKGFINFCQLHGHTVLPHEVNEPRLEQLKDMFHGGGGFRELEPIPGAVEAIKLIRKRGLKTVIVSARPYFQFRRIYSDTMEWLKTQGVEYDHLMFEGNKARAILRLQPAQVIGFVEDRAKHALELALAGVTVYKLPHPAGDGEFVVSERIIYVADWTDIMAHLDMRRSAR